MAETKTRMTYYLHGQWLAELYMVWTKASLKPELICSWIDRCDNTFPCALASVIHFQLGKGTVLDEKEVVVEVV